MTFAPIVTLAPYIIQALTLAQSTVEILAKDDPTEDDAAKLRRDLDNFDAAMERAYAAVDGLDATIAAKRAQGPTN